jgi:hypothetical protein
MKRKWIIAILVVLVVTWEGNGDRETVTYPYA